MDAAHSVYTSTYGVVLVLFTCFVLVGLARRTVGITRVNLVKIVIPHVLIHLLLPWINTTSVALTFTVCLSCVLLYSSLDGTILQVEGKAVLITGCDSGLGYSIALHLAERGFRVFAGCLKKGGEGEQRLRAAAVHGKLTTLQLDVTKENEIEKAVDFIRQETGDKLWGLLNNAGYCVFGDTELMPMDEIQAIYEVNILGPMRMCKAFLPFIRRSKGRIINTCSIQSFSPFCKVGIYGSTKAALYSFSETLRLEMKKWDVSVINLIPGFHRTAIFEYDRDVVGERWFNKATEILREDYGRDYFTVELLRKRRSKPQDSPVSFPQLNEAVEGILLSRKPSARYHVGALSWSVPFSALYLPTVISDSILLALLRYFKGVPRALQE